MAKRRYWKWVLGCGAAVILVPLVLFVGLVVYFAYIDINLPVAGGPAECDAVISSQPNLNIAREGFSTTFFAPETVARQKIIVPENFNLISYPSTGGDLPAYVNIAHGAKPGPAVVWLIGGLGNDVGNTPWEPAPVSNDQSGSGIWKSGISILYPVLRGGGNTHQQREFFMGEVDDVIAATKVLGNMPQVDADQIYLVGHSTGGVLALLVAASRSDLFAGVFSFGPVADVASYGGPFTGLNACERELRSPLWFMSSITTPTSIVDGSLSPNSKDLEPLRAAAGSAPVKVRVIVGEDHFSYLHRETLAIAKQIQQAAIAKSASPN